MRRTLFCIAVFLVSLLLLGTVVLRSSLVSDALKGLVLPEVSEALGARVEAERVYLNLVPVFAGVDGLAIYADESREHSHIAGIKVYFDLRGLLTRDLVLKRIVIKGTDLQLTEAEIDLFQANLKKYLSKESDAPVKVKVGAVVLHKSSIRYTTDGWEVYAKGLNAELALGDETRGIVSTPSLKVATGEGEPLEGRFKADFLLKDNMLKFREVSVLTPDSGLSTIGSLVPEELKGFLDVDLGVALHDVKRLFGLTGSGDGRVSARGTVLLEGRSASLLRTITLDLKVKGDLFLETLMELLEVDEPLRGSVSFSGSIRGPLNDLVGDGDAVLSKGNLFGVKVERLTTSIDYSKGIMSFSGASGVLYGGSARAEASITLPVVNHFSLTVQAENLNSKGIFELIGWDPMIPEGRVSAVLETSGSDFSPSGSFSFRSSTQGPDILGRVRGVTGTYALKDDVVSLGQLHVVTPGSEAKAEGKVDLGEGRITFAGAATTSDILDLSAPYFEGFRGGGRMSFAVGGPLKDPIIDLSFETGRVTFDTSSLGTSLVTQGLFTVDRISGSVSYRKNNLSISQSSFDTRNGGKLYMTGRIRFPKAQELFQLKEPVYDLSIDARSVFLDEVGPLISGSMIRGGVLTSSFALRGEAGHLDVQGDVSAMKVALRDAQGVIDAVRGKVFLREGAWSVTDGKISRGTSDIVLSGKLDRSRRFSVDVASPKVRLVDIVSVLPGKYPDHPLLRDTYLSKVKVTGEGNIANPLITIYSKMSSYSNGQALVDGAAVEGIFRGDTLSLSASLLDNRLRAKGSLSLTQSLPWSFSIDARKARYDRLVKAFFSEAPDDLLLSAEGTITGRGDKYHVHLDASLENVYVYLYGNGFSNSAPIMAQLRDRILTISRTTLRNNDTELSVSGDMVIGKSLNLSFEGASALEPARAFWKQIEALKGRASYVLSVTGDWNRPTVNGGIEIAGGVLGIKGVPYRVTDLSAYCYFDEDTVVLQNAKGRVSGGDIRISGTASIQRLTVRRFALETEITNVTMSPRKDLWISLNGNLFYRGTLESQTLSGDISVNRAKYTERIDWRSWILSARSPERPAGEFTKVDQTNLNIRVRAPSVVVDNNLARASLSLDIVLRGTLGRPIPFGKFEIKEGVVYFRNNEFTLKKGRVDFTNPTRINPYIDLIAETKVDLYSIRLSLNGTPEDFNLTLDSSPSLSETDIITVLAVGYVDSKSKGIGSGLGAAEASAFLAGKLQDTMDDRLRTVVGLDRIQVEPYVTKKTATVTPRLSVSKKLFGEEIYLTYATTLDTGTEQLWKVEYRVSKHVSLIGIRDERGGLGGDVKFRFVFR